MNFRTIPVFVLAAGAATFALAASRDSIDNIGETRLKGPLGEKLDRMVTSGKRRVTYVIPNREAGVLNKLYGLATVESVDYGPEAITVVAMADAKARGQLRAYAVDDEPKKKEDWE